MGICDCGCNFEVGSIEFQELHVGVEELEACATAQEEATMREIQEDETQHLEWSDLD